MKLAIVDIGYGNVGSIGVAFQRFGLDPEVTSDPERIPLSIMMVVRWPNF